MIKYFGGY